MKLVLKLCYSLFLTIIELCNVLSVRIETLIVPSSVENGTDFVILDCKYEIPPQDVSGLVLKWLLNDEVVYQWIPYSSQPQALGILKDRLDLEYFASVDKYQKHRALRILKATTSLSGDYTCRASTFEDEDFRTTKMTVFAPPKRLILRHYRVSVKHAVNITCKAEGVYPKPNMELHIPHAKHFSKTLVDETVVKYTKRKEAYDAVIYKVFFVEDLEAETVLECFLSLPDTDFTQREAMVYYPGSSSIMDDEDSHSSGSTALLSFFLIISKIFICLT